MDTWQIQAAIPQTVRSRAVEAYGVKCSLSQARRLSCWWRRVPESPLCGPGVTCVLFPLQPSDFSVSLKASGKNKHFKVQLVDNVYCIGQRRFHTMDELVEHYKKAPIFTSEHGEKLYLVRALP